jgi:hypothetical protein
MASANKAPAKADKRREVQWQKVDDLLLDNKNPRLPDGMEKASQGQLLAILAEDYALLDVGESIATNGYFSEEPLVTIASSSQKGKWVVVEGNRRLAAMLLLAMPTKAPANLVEKWREVARSAKSTVTEVPTLLYEDRSQITPYLGFRHITGVLAWRPYQKGRYIAHLVEDSKLSFVEISKLIGSKAKTVREHYVSYTLVRQARDSFNIDTSNAEESFGVLRRALSDPNMREHIDLELDQSEKDLARPLKKASATRLEELLGWIFGTKKRAAALTDSRDLSKLGAVIASKQALAALKSTNDLSYAFELSGGEEKRLIETLSQASYKLDQALPMVLRHSKSGEVIELAGKCQQVIREMMKLLKQEV